MVSSTTRKIISLAISLLVVVISLTGIALGASAPVVTKLSRYTPGFAGAPGKMARDAAGNFYVTDFWGKGVVKLDRQGNKTGFIPTGGRPSAVAVLADNRLVVAMSKPLAYVAFYSQSGLAPNVKGEELVQFGAPAQPLFNPTGITVDAAGYIYVVDSGDSSSDLAVNVGKVRVYSSAGAYLYAFGVRTLTGTISTVGGEFKQPAGIAYEKQGNQIVVVDTLNSRLQFFTAYNGTTCTYVSSVGSAAGYFGGAPVVGSAAKFYNPVDVAFEYSGAQVYRAYVVERARHEIAVVNVDIVGVYGAYLSVVNGTTVSGGAVKLPAAALFEKTAIGGVLYTNDAVTSTAADILSFGLDSGTIPVPAVSMTMAAVPATSTTSPITVTGTTSPANAVTCSVNGGAGVAATGTASWSASLPLINGYNYILCQSTSGGVTTYIEANTYYTLALGTAPTVAISQPSAGLYTNNLSLPVTGTSDTANATVQLVNSLNSFTTTTQTGADKKWSALVNLAEGSNLITATAWKQGTSTSAPATVTVVGDITPPNMTGTISFLANGATTNKAVQNLDGVVLEANLSSITVNGVAVPASERVTMAGNNTYFSVPVTLVRDSNTVTVKATDLAGNSTTMTRTVTLKPEIPGMTVTLPADNSYMTTAGAVAANGTVDPTFTSVVAGGTAVTPAAGSWSTAALNVSSGFGSYQFTASGGSNATVTEKRTINTAASFEQIAITSPAADLATNAASVVVSGSVLAGSLTPQISIDGAGAVNVTTYTSATGAFSHTVTLASQGLHTVKLIGAGGTTAVRNILYDTIPPNLTLQADSKLMPASITGTIDPSAKMSTITASLGGTVTIPISAITFDPYDQSGAVVWHANLSAYAYDSISFTTVDPAGNSTTLSYKQGIPTGDIDGDGVVRLADALAALRHVAGTETITDPTKFFNGDVGGLVAGHVARNGIIDITDSVLILNKAYGLMAF